MTSSSVSLPETGSSRRSRAGTGAVPTGTGALNERVVAVETHMAASILRNLRRRSSPTTSTKSCEGPP